MPINTFETSFEARDRRYQVEKLYHGETVDLVGVITTDGVLKNITGYSVQGVFQPTTKQGTDEFYELSADIVDNKVIVHWDKGKDFGEPSYMVWALLTDGNDASYPIVWRLDMAYSPNFPLSALDPIPKTIDFSKYELLNAPWAMLSDFQDLQEDVSELSDGLSAYAKKEDIPEVEGKYLPLSGGIVTGTLSVDGTFESSNFKGAAGIMIGYNAKAKTGSIAIGSSSNVTNAHYVGSNVAIGTAAKIGSISETDCAVAVGIGATVNGDYGIAIGHSANAEGANSIAIGSSGSRVQALAPESIQIGGLSNGLWTPNNTPHSLKVFDKMVLSGDNLTLDPERVPYLSGYAKKEDIPEVPTDLSAFTNSPGYLTAHQSLEDYYTKEEADGKFLTAHQSLSDYYTKEEADGKFLTAHQDLTDYATKDFVQSEISDFVTEDALTGLATKEELTAYAQLSDLENIDIDGMSACLSSAEFDEIEELPNDGSASLSSIIEKIDEVIRALKRANGPQPPDPTKTRVIYTDDTTAELDLVGNVTASSIPNINSVKAISFGTNVTSLAASLFDNKTSLVSVEIPNTVTAIPSKFVSYTASWRDSSLTSAVLPDTITSIGEQAFRGSKLASIDIPASTTTLGNQAYVFSRSAKNVYISPALTSIGVAPFAICFSLSSLVVDQDNPNYKSVDDAILLSKDGTKVIQVAAGVSGTITIPEGVTSFEQDSAGSLSNCTSLVLPSTLTTIGSASIDSSQAQWGFSTLTIPSSVTSISQYAFSKAVGKTIVMEGKTMAQVQGMSNYPWDVKSGSGTQFVCTDGTITR